MMNIKKTTRLYYIVIYCTCIIYTYYIYIYSGLGDVSMGPPGPPKMQPPFPSNPPGESASTAWISPWAAQVNLDRELRWGHFESFYDFFWTFFLGRGFYLLSSLLLDVVSLDSRCKKEVTAWGLNWKIWSRYFLSIPCMAWWGPLTTYIHN